MLCCLGDQATPTMLCCLWRDRPTGGHWGPSYTHNAMLSWGPSYTHNAMLSMKREANWWALKPQAAYQNRTPYCDTQQCTSTFYQYWKHQWGCSLNQGWAAPIFGSQNTTHCQTSPLLWQLHCYKIRLVPFGTKSVLLLLSPVSTFHRYQWKQPSTAVSCRHYQYVQTVPKNVPSFTGTVNVRYV